MAERFASDFESGLIDAPITLDNVDDNGSLVHELCDILSTLALAPSSMMVQQLLKVLTNAVVVDGVMESSTMFVTTLILCQNL
jgi:hypothetical protein